jgi:hypothetical protein
MCTASLHLDEWSLAWREFWRKLAPGTGHHDCVHTHGLWRHLRGRVPAVQLEGSRYCLERCLERALRDALQRVHGIVRKPVASHRVPLGLLLLSRQQISVEQLRAALEAQRAASRGRIGEWLQALGFASQDQITAALARQWSCPVLRAPSAIPRSTCAPRIPLPLLEAFIMVPVHYVKSTETLHIAFGEGIDYSILYAIEQMTGCRTEPCMAIPSFVHANLESLCLHRAENEIFFDHVSDLAEISRIIRSYCSRLTASEIRLAACGPYLWVRLLRTSHTSVDLLLGPPPFTPGLVGDFNSMHHRRG